MPFTGSHPAAVIPLMRTGPVPSALVIGSMVPDLPYYLPLPIGFDVTHTLGGLVSIDLAMALVCFALWQVLLAPVAVALAPEPLRRRLAPALPVPWRHHVRTPRAAALVVAGILVGSLTHVVWDAFTHVDHWGPRHIAWLADRHGSLTGYRWAQYASGIVGLVVIATSAWGWWRRTPQAGAGSQRVPRLGRSTTTAVWATVLGAAALGAALGIATARSHGDVLSRVLYRAATVGGGAGLLAALICAAWCARVLARGGATSAGRRTRGDG